MNVLLFIVAIAASFIVVRIGAIAFEMTGLPWPLAKFQALSCFTGTGFTTREAELITGHHQRRRIATYLIIIGHAGLVTLIATFANSLGPTPFIAKIKIPYFHTVFPIYIVPWINLFVIAASLFILFRIIGRSSLAKRMNDSLRAHIVKKRIIRPVTFEELLVATGGFGVLNIEIGKKSPVRDKTLAQAKLARQGVIVLAIEREGVITPSPPAETKMLAEDKVICFGKMDQARDIIQGTHQA